MITSGYCAWYRPASATNDAVQFDLTDLQWANNWFVRTQSEKPPGNYDSMCLTVWNGCPSWEFYFICIDHFLINGSLSRLEKM